MTKKAEAKGIVRIKRDKDGLITEPKVDYVFDENGFIDWRKMLNDDWLYPNPTKNLRTTDVSKLEDNDLCVLLQGYKELAQIRGYTDVTYDVNSPSPDYVIATCSITWKPNYETEGEEVVFSAIGDASPNNTSGFGRSFLAACAENRAFVRCVRNFLRINIVSKEELSAGGTSYDQPNQQQNSSDPKALLEDLMKKKRVSFDMIKTKLDKEDYDTSSLNSIGDLPKIKVFELIERLKSAKSKS